MTPFEHVANRIYEAIMAGTPVADAEINGTIQYRMDPTSNAIRSALHRLRREQATR